MQDLEPDPRGGGVKIREGVARDWRVSVEDREIRHGRKSKSKLRERVAVEHKLAHLARRQGRRARYRGQRKNLFDLRRSAAIHNLHVLMRRHPTSLPEAA